MAKAENMNQVDESAWTTQIEPYADTFPFDNPGDSVTGQFVGVRELEQEGLDGQPRMVKVYEIQELDSEKKWSVWGSAMIDMGMETVNQGQLVRITFEGKKDLDQGRTVKTFCVQSQG